MEEVARFIKAWIIAIICLCYCYYTTAKIPKGILRLLSLLPVVYIFIILPFNLTSVHLCSATTFPLVWLANFKLLLFSLDHGPLSPPPPKLLQFILLACLPIQLKTKNNSNPSPQISLFTRSILLVVKILLMAIILHSYYYIHLMHPYVVFALYCAHTYLELEFVLAIFGVLARALFGFELDRQFDEPYLSSSLQDFWSRRWNLAVTSILRSTVYFPTRYFFKRIIGSTGATLVAVMASFLVSGLMHEILICYVTHVSPTWEVTCFFVLHGFCLAIEVAVKKVVRDRWRMPVIVSMPFTMGFIATTSFWLFFPQILKNGIDDKIIRELLNTVDFIKGTN
ncbi:probable long-chain-alcohol O-fatty-acyltransferase 1 [Manihot esculenta]|uniref:Uncharacterized protein n=1 Tax=Manihot esculenta TaxID=3983 RepID=A0A2C9W8A4_MANES|nr:probable long-chain-alcohol O-fatty-acyltransferase 1 [Manihot esculenta]OAY55670.2 hypothetical protein MANES_03G134712v8 [Manihot esculenta]